MIRAFHKQLHSMSQDAQDPFARYIHLQAGDREASRYEAPLRRMILHMPALVKRIQRWSGDTQNPWRVRRLHNFVLAYLMNPEDFLPEKHEGLFGYLDDAYLVARAYEVTLDELRYGQDPLEDILVQPEELHNWIQLTRELLPHVVEQIDRAIDTLEEPQWAGSGSTRHERN